MGDTTEMKYLRATSKAFAAGLVFALALGACGGAQDGPDEPDGQSAAYGPPANTTGAWAGVQPTVYPTAPMTAPYNPPPVPPPPPPSEQECRARGSRTQPYDVSGVTDVKVQFGKFFDAQHDSFRCCFDALEGPQRPGYNAKVSLIVRVDPGGKLINTEFAKDSEALSPATSRCILDIAAGLSYPAPIGGTPVAYVRIFDFKAHR